MVGIESRTQILHYCYRVENISNRISGQALIFRRFSTMRVTVEYMAQIKRAAGTGREVIELPSGTTLTAVLSQLAENHGDPLAGMLLDADGNPIRSLLLFLGDEQVRLEENPTLTDGSQLTISTPISGG